jgi:hypothetical protein
MEWSASVGIAWVLTFLILSSRHTVHRHRSLLLSWRATRCCNKGLIVIVIAIIIVSNHTLESYTSLPSANRRFDKTHKLLSALLKLSDAVSRNRQLQPVQIPRCRFCSISLESPVFTLAAPIKTEDLFLSNLPTVIDVSLSCQPVYLCNSVIASPASPHELHHTFNQSTLCI